MGRISDSAASRCWTNQLMGRYCVYSRHATSLHLVERHLGLAGNTSADANAAGLFTLWWYVARPSRRLMELRQLQHFVAVAEERHVTTAAARCHIGLNG